MPNKEAVTAAGKQLITVLICGLLASSCAMSGGRALRGYWDIDSSEAPQINGYPWLQWVFVDADQPNHAKLIWQTPIGCQEGLGQLRKGAITTAERSLYADGSAAYSIVMRFHGSDRATLVFTDRNGATREFPFRRTGRTTFNICEG